VIQSLAAAATARKKWPSNRANLPQQFQFMPQSKLAATQKTEALFSFELPSFNS
jgi:hypothetical protein